MKVVIPYKHFPGPELKYTLRAIERFIDDPEVIIIGDLPVWVRNVTHIPFKDNEDLKWKERNIFEKILLVKDDFLFFNDDHFLLKKFTPDIYHYSGTLAELKQRYSLSNSFRKTIQNTINVYGDIPNYFRHAPILVERDKLESLTELDWSIAWSYCIKSAYCHVNEIKGEDYPDLKFRHQISEENIRKQIEGRPYFSTGNAAMGRSMVKVLESLYPNKSIYEDCNNSI